MTALSEALDSLLSEFKPEENLIQENLRNLQTKRQELIEGINRRPWIRLQFETLDAAFRTKENALKRNKTLRRELNISMSRLRSKQCYNPAEDNLNKMIEKYSEILSRVD